MAERHDRSSEFAAGSSNVSAELAGLQSQGGNPPNQPAHDVLSDVFRTIRLTAALFFPLEASSPWADEVPAAKSLAAAILPAAQHLISYHVVSSGSCCLALEDDVVPLEAGDVVVIPHGEAYVMSSAPGMRPAVTTEAALAFFRQMASGSGPSLVVEDGGGAERVSLVCGFLGCDLRPFNPVLEALPRLVHLRARTDLAGRDRLAVLIDFAIGESRERCAGAESVLLRLSEVLFIEAIRRYLQSLSGDRTGWLAGLRDPVVGRVLALLHQRPTDAWSLEQLANEVGVSRSTLADRFTHVMGQPPMRYLARWRMQLASRMLLDGTAKVSAVAIDVGYQSEAAFSRAFKETVGVSPAEWRRAHARARQ